MSEIQRSWNSESGQGAILVHKFTQLRAVPRLQLEPEAGTISILQLQGLEKDLSINCRSYIVLSTTLGCPSARLLNNQYDNAAGTPVNLSSAHS